MKVINIQPGSSDFQDAEADLLRGELAKEGILYVNLLSSPGSGKTTLLLSLLDQLSKDLCCGIMEADFDSTVDAVKLENAGYKTIQLHTDSLNYLDASMSRQGLDALQAEDLDAVFLENVGSLVRPVGMDSGAHTDILIFSIPEGIDKPLKYPLMFQKSDLLVINKMDVLPYFDFDMDKFKASIHILNPGMQIMEVSAKTGEGVAELAQWIRNKHRAVVAA